MEKTANIQSVASPEIGNVFRFWEKMKNAGTSGEKDLLYISSAAIMANILSWVLVTVFLKKETLNIILHYNVLSGIDYQGDQAKLFTIPAIGMFIFLMNFAIARFVKSKDRFISYLLLLTALLNQVFVIIAVVAIILINNKG